MKQLVGAILILVLMNTAAHADRVHLKSGQTVDGRVIQEGNKIFVVRGGTVSEFAMDAITRIEALDTVWDQFNRRYEQVNWNDSRAIFALIDFAAAQNLPEELPGLYRKVLAVDADNGEANRALQRVKLAGQWMDQDTSLQLQGLVQDESGAWITREEAALQKADVAYREQAATRHQLITRLLRDLFSQNSDAISRAETQLEEMENEYPGLRRKARQVREYFSAFNEDTVSYDGKYVTVVLRLTDVGLDPHSPGGGLEELWMTLGTGIAGTAGGDIVAIQLPHQRHIEVRSTVMIPVK